MKEISEIADVVEFRIWGSGTAYTFSSLQEDLQAAIDEEDFQATVSEKEGQADEIVAQQVIDEIQARQMLLQNAYPFICDGNKVELNSKTATTASAYLFCLALSSLPAERITNEQRTRQFETLAMEAASSFFSGEKLRIGAPWQSPEIPTYEDLLRKVLDLIPDIGPTERDAAPAGGDCGWDVLIVKGFRDKSFPRLIVLGNCATGRTDWMTKGKDTAPSYFFKRSFTQDHRSVLITFFAVPFIMDEDAKLRKNYGDTILFDRFRICEYAPNAPQESAAWLESNREAALELPFN